MHKLKLKPDNFSTHESSIAKENFPNEKIKQIAYSVSKKSCLFHIATCCIEMDKTFWSCSIMHLVEQSDMEWLINARASSVWD